MHSGCTIRSRHRPHGDSLERPDDTRPDNTKPAIQGRGSMFRSCAGLVALSSLLLSGAALAQEKIKVGVTATLEGTYTVLGEDGIRGHQTAINTLGKKIGDKELEFIIASTDATPDSAIRAVPNLIEQAKVETLPSPFSGDG